MLVSPHLTVDTLYVISDLHLGGRTGFQIFRAKATFEILVEALLKKARHRRIGLIINGDFVDFLAEAPSAYFDPLHAVEKLDRILSDDSFSAVTSGITRLLNHENIVVAIALGNHDLELTLPWVARHLSERLTSGNLAARARLVLELSGLGISAKVGSAAVLCIHGNEFDEWNVTDYESLRIQARDLIRGAAPGRYIPNAGTHLVVDVMNEIKYRFPFIDLLKPETDAVLPILVALDPSLVARIPNALRAVARFGLDTARMRTGLLGDVGEGAGESQRDVASYPSRVGDERVAHIDELLSRTEANFRSNVTPAALALDEERGSVLGYGEAFRHLALGKPKLEILRAALERIDTDRSFDHKAEDQMYIRADRAIPASVDFIVTGHTHLARSLPRQNGDGYYFNSGTWASLMRLKPETRQNAEAFATLFASLAGGDIGSLDRAGLLLQRPTVVSISSDGHRVKAALQLVEGASQPFKTVPGSECFVG